MFRIRNRGVVALVALATVVSLAACSESNDQETSTGGAPASLTGSVNDHGTTSLAGADPSVEVELDDNYFGPTFLEVESGATVKVDLRNEGSTQHSLTTDDGVDVVVDPDQTGEAELAAPDSGQLSFYCRFHKQNGMQGAVVVSDSGAAPAGGPASSDSSTTSKAGSSGGYGY